MLHGMVDLVARGLLTGDLADRYAGEIPREEFKFRASYVDLSRLRDLSFLIASRYRDRHGTQEVFPPVYQGLVKEMVRDMVQGSGNISFDDDAVVFLCIDEFDNRYAYSFKVELDWLTVKND